MLYVYLWVYKSKNESWFYKKNTSRVDIDSFISKRRNELICDIFIMCKAMEDKGTGFEKILEDYKNVDLKYKPFIFAKNNQFSIVLPDLTNKDGVGLYNMQ